MSPEDDAPDGPPNAQDDGPDDGPDDGAEVSTAPAGPEGERRRRRRRRRRRHGGEPGASNVEARSGDPSAAPNRDQPEDRSAPRADSGGPRADDRAERTDNRGQRTDNRGQRTDNRGQRGDNRGQRGNRGPGGDNRGPRNDPRNEPRNDQRRDRLRLDDKGPRGDDHGPVRGDAAVGTEGPTVRLDPRRPMAAPDDVDLEGPTAPAIPWGRDDDGPPPVIALAADLPVDAPADDPDPVTFPLVEVPSAALGDDVASVAGVRFVAGGRIQWCDVGETDYAVGERVMVDTDRGARLAWIAVAPSRKATRDRGVRRIMRRANDHDLRGEREGDADRASALRTAKDKAMALRLPMKVYRVDLNGQLGRGARINVYYTSDERLDLRDFIRELAQATSNSRIELRQLGVRDEAKAVGGIGSCGLTLCCTTWLPDFVPVSIKMAKDQGLVLSPTKVSGQCGRLKCCLVYEQAGYAELRKGLPKLGKRVIGARGEGRVVEVDVLRQRVRVSYGPGDTEVVPATEVRPMFPSGNQPKQEQPPGAPPEPADDTDEPGDSLDMPAAVDGTAPDALSDDEPS